MRKHSRKHTPNESDMNFQVTKGAWNCVFLAAPSEDTRKGWKEAITYKQELLNDVVDQ